MTILLTIIAVVVIFSVLVLIHEYGHFIAARRNGIKVLEFGIGFPPRLFKKKIGETLYTVNAIPFGGFVKLYGEDSTDAKIIHDRRSFAHKNAWVRTKVVVAGVAMNFILAIVLLTVGFSFGIEPLLVTERDLFTYLESGDIKSAPGIYVAKAGQRVRELGVKPGDQILAIDDKPIVDSDQLAVFQKGKTAKDIDIAVRHLRGGEAKIHIPFNGEDIGINLKPFTDFPRLSILDVKNDSASERAGLRKGDIILAMNGEAIYSPVDFEEIISGTTSVAFNVLRHTQILEIPVTLPDQRRIVIADVFVDSAAQRAGFQRGDVVVSIDGILVFEPEQLQGLLKSNPRKGMVYMLDRNGSRIEVRAATGENNLLGVALSSSISFRNTEISFYRDNVLTSITEIKKVRYNPWVSFKKAISETVRLTGLTIVAFGRTVGSIFSKFTVPDDIGGPVQIAYYTHTFVQEGFFALLRFTALLSLSLAVINILPIPALDGGRFLFILFEIITKKRVNARIESIIHSIGFILLLGLIVLVTFSDIARLI